METVDEVVYVLDHDTRVREALCAVLRVNGKNVRAFASRNAFLACRRGGGASCLLLDMRMPDMSGLEVQNLVNREAKLPIIEISVDPIRH
ncbi:response regulator [Paraburkholderia sp. BCC1876]|uniref:response regulator n=1 Tax=Paraburkholderia sp. BCC1876 TaxID=2676303 RepID=UPI001592885C|nr:response regulator [Paraburkholderia sp. BCC1876]